MGEGCSGGANLASLSIWSPNPGVSTMVSEIRVPSSSSSSSGEEISDMSQKISACVVRNHVPTVRGLILTPSSMCALEASSASLCSRTDLPQSVLTKVVRPREAQCESANSPLKLGGGELYREWVGQRRTSARCTTHHQAKLNALLDILLSADNLL